MDITQPRLLSLLHQVKQIRHEYELTARITGENFNVFTILGLSTAEVRTHSAFLAELLNTKGSHGQGSVYLKLFLQQVNIGSDIFTADGASAKVEYYIGPVDLSDGVGGQIDILLTDEPQKRHIIIENKIYAGDQEQQLVRYYKFDPKATLLYLTLYGKLPDNKSSAGLDVNRITCVSYKDHILDWLDECLKASVSLPVIRETIIQYVFLIRKLTGKAKEVQVTEQVKKLIAENPDLVESIAILGDAWSSIVKETKTKFFNLARSTVVKSNITANGQFLIGLTIAEDADGLYIGVNLRNRADNKTVSAEVERKYIAVFKGVTNSNHSSPTWHIGWFNPSPFKHRESFESLPRKDILSFYSDNSKLEKFIERIKKQVDDLVNALINA